MPPASRLACRRVLTAFGLIAVGSLGIQISSGISAGLFSAYGTFGTSALRMAVAALVLIAVVRPGLRGRSRREWVGIVVYGAAMALMNLCLYNAIERLPLGVAVTLDFLGPCVVALLASRRLREGLCAVASLLGVALISAGPWGYFDAWGYAARLGAAVFFGLYTVCAARVGKAGSGLDGLALSVAVAALLTLPLALPRVGEVTASGWGWLAVSAVVGVVIPYSVDTIAGRITSARVIGTLFAIDPAMGVLVGRVMLGEELGLLAVAGIAVVMAAGASLVWLSESPVSPESSGSSAAPEEPAKGPAPAA